MISWRRTYSPGAISAGILTVQVLLFVIRVSLAQLPGLLPDNKPTPSILNQRRAVLSTDAQGLLQGAR